MQERNRGAKRDIFADIWHCSIFTAASVVAAGAVVVAAGVVGVGCGATGLINCVCEITEIRNNLAAARPWGSIISNTTVSSLDNTPQHHHQPRIRPDMGQRLGHLFPVCCFLWISH